MSTPITPQYGKIATTDAERQANRNMLAAGVNAQPEGTYKYDPVSGSLTKKDTTVLSTVQGKDVLQGHIDTHNADMTNLQNAQGNATAPVPETGKVTDNPAIKSIGGLTADEAKTTGTDLTNYAYDTSSGYFIPKEKTATAGADEKYAADSKAINDAFSTQIAGMDAASQQLVDSIKGIYDSRIADEKTLNEGIVRRVNMADMRTGGRYTPGSTNSLLTITERAGLDRIKKISAEEAGLLAQANQSLTDKKYTAFVEQRRQLESLRTERQTTLNKLQDEALSVQKTQQAQLDQAKKDQSIVDVMNTGVTDPQAILTELNKSGAKFTLKDVKDSIASISPLGDASKLSADARDFFILKQAGGGALPASITALPEDQQLMAYIKMKGDAARKATVPKPTDSNGNPITINKLSPAEANKYGMPPEMIGMDEKQVLISLQNEEAPQWFIDMLASKSGGNDSFTKSPTLISSLWDQFRNEALAKVQPPEKTPKPATDAHSKALDYFTGTYGSQITEEQATSLADRVDLYVKGGMSYKDAVDQTVKDASQ